MDNKNVIASALSDNELAKAFSELVAERWDNWDLSVFLPYLVDTCAPAALPYLADQFDVDGLRGFVMAVSEEQQRDIIKKSIALHKFIGTPWAIREACRTVGFPVIELYEGVPAISGGEDSPDDWARFRILIEADEHRYITAEETRKLRLFVEFYKNERSHLVELGFYQSFEEKLFRREPSERDELDVTHLSLIPNPVYLTPIGTPVKVAAHSNGAWSIKQQVFKWSDGGRLMLGFTGEAGDSEITVTSDCYVRDPVPKRAYSRGYADAYRFPDGEENRVMKIPIYTANDKKLGILTVIQSPGENNAYSPAYSNAYNIFNHDATQQIIENK